MEMLLGFLILIGGIILFVVDFIKDLTYYNCKAKGNIMDEATSFDSDHYKCYKYTISYLVNGKTYIYQQKSFQDTKLNNKNIIIKYNKKHPEKSRIQGQNIWMIGILLIVISLFFISIMHKITKFI